METPLTAEQLQTFVENIESNTLELKTFYWILVGAIILVAIGIVAYLKKKFENVAEKEDLSELTVIVEKVKAEIQFVGKQQEIHYGYYFQKKAEVLAAAYGKLRTLHRELKIAVEESIDPETTKEKWLDCRDSLWAFKEFVDDNKIFLEVSIELDLEKILKELYNILHISGYSSKLSMDQGEIKVALFERALTSIGTPMTSALDALASSFKKHISAPTSSDNIKS